MKRRRTRTPSDAGSPSQEKKAVKSPPTSSKSASSIKDGNAIKSSDGQHAANLEDIEVEKRSAATDVASFERGTEEIRKLVAEIQREKLMDADTNESRIRCTLLFTILKKLNRLSHMRCKKARERTQESKQKVDSLHLQLQNLLYEVMHLKKEITKCLEFKSKDEEIELVPEAEFFKDAPKEISKPDVTKEDSHQLMLARLDWELEQRKRLAVQKEQFLEKKETLMKEIHTKKEFLDSLQPRLENILKATQPVQEYMNMPLDAQRLQHETARYLPQPLYILYVQASAYSEACDRHLEVKILGDLDIAKAAIETKTAAREIDSDSDQENPDGHKRSKHRRKKEEARLEEKRKLLLKKHPLQILIQVRCKVPGPVLANSALLSPESLLTNLFPDDGGDKAPNPSSLYQLAQVGVTTFAYFVSLVGKPYMWAQRICGLDFLPEELHEVVPKSSVSLSHMEATIKAVRARILARLALQQQLTSLEGLTIPGNKNSLQMFPSKISAKLSSWQPATFEEFMEKPELKRLVDEGFIEENDMLFQAVFERSKVHLKASVVLSQEYPTTPPLFSIAVTCGQTVIRDSFTKAIEAEVNVFYPELTAHDSSLNLLANQLRRLQMCFDIYLECGCLNDVEGAETFDREKFFLRVKKGRDRGLPLKYDSNQGLFTQR
ncbi:THO complex subunit 5 [Desmophyllum pertusum]|uniref:THO complex subunit 5 n=1 Tax=Desmophyllum pertusum TaxID=174260 RepID=A0A9X0D5P5_9CNID|nr:THO complex subunit 5 [Desmophyllum pertusum]